MKPFYRSFTAVVCAAVLLGSPVLPTGVDCKQYLEDVKQLSSESMKGRATGSPGLDKAARYIAHQFEKIGLQPGNGNTYFQSFPVAVESRLGSHNQFSFTSGHDRGTLKAHEDFIPFPFSASGRVQGTAVFAGYGITAAEYGYDDYEGVDARGKVAVVLRHEPQEFDSNSVFEGRIYTEHSQLFSKALNAKAHGAIAIAFVNDTAAHSSDSLEKFVTLVGPANPGLPFVQVNSAIAEKWFETAGRSLKTIQEEIDKDLRPRSFAFPSLLLDMNVEIRQTTKEVLNVVGYLPGSTPEHLVVGAHYDHLGLGEQYSLAPNLSGTIHPGADDNASGTAGVIELARWFASQPRSRRGVLFIAFAGEELGLLGSTHYVNHPLLPLENAAVMINMDMIGRIRDHKVTIGGSGGASGFRSMIQEIGSKYPFELDLTEQGVYGSSDHTSFMTRLVPVLFFFSGLHADYHKPSDTWDKIEPQSTAALLDMIAEIAARIAHQEGKPQFVKHGAAGSDASAAQQ
jgi:hypothetical protein